MNITGQSKIHCLDVKMQLLFLFVCLPSYFKYSTIGFIAGHEYTHGFDTKGLSPDICFHLLIGLYFITIVGRLYDEFGNLVNWWSESSQEEFDRRTKCYVEQYSNYSIGGGQVEG